MHGTANSAGTHRSAGAAAGTAGTHRSTIALISTCAAGATCAGALEDGTSTRSDRCRSRGRCVNGTRASLRHNHATHRRSVHNGRRRWWSCHFCDRLRNGSRCHRLRRNGSSCRSNRRFHNDRSHRNAGGNRRCRCNDDRRSGARLRNDAATCRLRCRRGALRGERQRRHDRLRVGCACRRSDDRSWRRYWRSRVSHNDRRCGGRRRSHYGPCHNRRRGRRSCHHRRWRYGDGRSGRWWYSHHGRPCYDRALSKGRCRGTCSFCLFALEDSARDVSRFGGLGEIDPSACVGGGGGRTRVGRATGDVASHELGFAGFNGARMGLFSATPTAVRASRMDLLFTSSSRARSLMRTLLNQSSFCSPAPSTRHSGSAVQV